MSTQLLVSAVGAAVGFVASGFNPAGAQYGWMIGAAIAAVAFQPTIKSQGPRLEDNKVTGLAYGQAIPWIQGSYRTGGFLAWSSDKREIATTTRSDGKGGPKQQNTTYSYEIDCLFVLSSNELDGLLRVWDNGKLIYSADADSTDSSLIASSESEAWRRITFYGGATGQGIDPVYEAAVGADNAPHYEGRATVFIEGLDLGQSGQMRQLTFEVGTNLTPGASQNYQDQSPVQWAVVPSGAGSESHTVPSPSVFGASLELMTSDPLDVGPGGENFLFRTQDFTIRGWAYRDFVAGATRVLMTKEGDVGNAGGWSLNVDTSARLQFYGLVNNSRTHTLTAVNAVPFQQWFYFEVRRRDERIDMFMGLAPGGPKSHEAMATGVTELMNGNAAPLGIGRGASGNGGWIGYMDDVVIEFSAAPPPFEDMVEPVPAEPYVVTPNTGLYLPFFYLPTVTRGYETLRTVVERLCARADMPAGTYDASALDAITKPVRSLGVSQVGGTRATLEILSQSYFFQSFGTDVVHFVPRAQSPVVTIPYEDLGTGQPLEGSPSPLALRMASDIELPAQEAVTYSNVTDDYQPDTQYSDRLTSTQTTTSPVTIPLGFTPSEAKAIADARIYDSAVGIVGAPLSLPRSYSRLTPSDTVLIRDKDGSIYRMVLGRLTARNGIMGFEARMEDPTVFTQAGLTGGDYQPQTEVVALPGTYLVMMDIPLLRDADDGIGLYAAARSLRGPWPGAELLESTDDISYSPRATFSSSGVMGMVTAALGNWTGPNVFDESSSLIVTVGAGVLNSATRDQLIENTTVNAALIGNEIVQFRSASLLSPGVYLLTGFLRGRRGTERFMTGHTLDERFVLLQLAGLRRVDQRNADLMATRYFRGVTFGRALSTASPLVVVNTGASQMPFSPVDARANRNTTNTVISWNRRTRLETRFLGPLSSYVPLGEEVEAYQVDIFSNNTFTTVVRTLTSGASNVTYTNAQQVTDFGSGQTVLYVRIYQMSAAVGRGYPLQATI